MQNDFRLINSFIFYVAVLFFLGIGAATLPQLPWYYALTRPVWTPSHVVVSTIWLLIFLSTAASLSKYWDTVTHDRTFRWTVRMYAGMALLVLLWNYLFFGAHMVALSVWAAALVTLAILAILLRVRTASAKAALYMVPFLVWGIFATYIVHVIALFNP